MKDLERVKTIYGHDTAANYTPIRLEQMGYSTYLQALQEGCVGENLKVLDLGCGTGRYFHCLRNVSFLMGVDISMDMLKVAEATRLEAGIIDTATSILLQADFRSIQFMPGSFDFIYSIGTIGEYAPFDQLFLESLVEWLKDGGKAFFTIVDRSAYQIEHPVLKFNFRKSVQEFILENKLFRFLSPLIRNKQIYTSCDFLHLYMTKDEVVRILSACIYPIQYEIIQFRDSKYQKIGVKLIKG